MCRTRYILCRRRFGDRHVLQWIEKLNRHLKFFVKEFPHVGHASTAATEEDSSRTTSLLLGAVVRDGTHQFRMETGHGTARDFRNLRNVRIGGFGVSTAQANKTIPLFTSFRRGKRFVEFPRDRSGDCAA